jgi:group I intron endonuclease
MRVTPFYEKSRRLFLQELVNNLTSRIFISMNIISGIYGLRNKTTNKWYIGCSINIHKRWITAYKRISCKGQKKIYSALQKYGYDDFDKVILEECPQETFKSRETYWIEKYNSVQDGYNLAPGGEGGYRPIGIPCSEETKLKIGKANKGKKWTDEMKQAASVQRKGKLKSDEWKKSIAEALRGTPLTEERKANISKSLKGKPRWTDEDKTKMSENRAGNKHPRWTPIPIESQIFIREYYKSKSANWIRVRLPTKITQKKLERCIKNLRENPEMTEVSDFI